MTVSRRAAELLVYEMKVTLDGSTPAIWRRIRVKNDVSLVRLHHILQATMGWGGVHHHQFIVRGRCYGRPTAEGDVQDERCVKLGQVAARAGSRLTYEYDLGDGWMHDVVVERIVPPDPEAQYPVCLAGERACPPEDVGGINGYYDFLDALQNARLAGHASVLEWIGGHFEPDVFDLETVNRRLRRIGQRRRSSL